MAKVKNRKKLSSDVLKSKKTASRHKNHSKSPFEVHNNNEKLNVLGRKTKHGKGQPGVSRAKSIEKRKKSLLEEYKARNKSNVFSDKRIGERNGTLSVEDKQIVRFAAVRARSNKRKSIFNLGEDEILTHKGQSITEIEKFEDVKSEDDSEVDTGKLDESFVEEAHFGGGVLRKTGIEGAQSHKDLIEQLIVESKKRKAEKKKIKEATLGLTEKLDNEWKDLLPLVNKINKKSEDPIETTKVDNYDRVMRELKFEARGTVSDRLKSEDEIAEQERKKLEQLENERLERMRSVVKNHVKKNNHRSADDLDDDFVYKSDEDLTLSYNNEGVSNIPIETSTNESDHEDFEQDEDENEDKDSDDDAEDNLSDLKEDTSCSEDDEVQDKKIKTDSIKRKEIMEKAREELPYIIPLPDSYENLIETFGDHPNDSIGVIITRMIKSNPASLAEGNKDNLGLLFRYLLQYVNAVASEAITEKSIRNCFNLFDIMTPQLFELSQLNKDNCQSCVLEIIEKKAKEYWKSPKMYPGLESLVFLKMVSLLFPTSDFQHRIVSPCLMFMEKMLFTCRVKAKKDISYGMFLVTLILEYTSLSKRLSPGCLTYLESILRLAIPKSTIRLVNLKSPFHLCSFNLTLLSQQVHNDDTTLKMQVIDLIDGKITETFKLRILNTAINIIRELSDNMEDASSYREIFEAHYDCCQKLQSDMYPEVIKRNIDEFTQTFEKITGTKKMKYIVMKAKRPKPLRLYEPKIVEVYDGKKHKLQSKEKAERDKLIHKLKRERKGAIREIRKDNAFLGKLKITQQIQSDKERKEKVKKIFAEASVQQRELNALSRQRQK